ncbi:MAG: rhomboid family intramembrane serine protease [Phycisphaerae bacterium]
MIPIGTDCPVRRRPWMNYLLILINVACFFLPGLLVDPNQAPAGGAHLNAPSVIDHFMLYGRAPIWWQFITYQFLHANLSHLFGNMVFLYAFGNNLNDRLGHWAYLLFYLGGGIVAGLVQVSFSDAPTLGASGSVSAITGLYMVLLPLTDIKLLVWFFMYVDVWLVPSMYLVLFSLAKDVLFSVTGIGGPVAYMAHIGGVLIGIAVGLLILWLRLIPRDLYDLMALMDRWQRRRQHRAIVAQGYNPFEGRTRLHLDTRQQAPQGVDFTTGTDDATSALRATIETAVRGHQPADAARCYLELRQLDPKAVLPAEVQLDVANQLMHQGNHTEAAQAYADFLAAYPRSAETANVHLIKGLLHVRYLNQPAPASTHLAAAVMALPEGPTRELARRELAKVSPPLPGTIAT